MHFVTCFASVAAIYSSWLATLRQDLLSSTRVGSVIVQRVWVSFLELGLRGDCARVRGRLIWPGGYNMSSMREAMPGSHWAAQGNTGRATLLNRPSWLLGNLVLFQTFMEHLYRETGWVQSTLIEEGEFIIFMHRDDWTGPELAMCHFIRCNGFELGVWVNARLVCHMISKCCVGMVHGGGTQ